MGIQEVDFFERRVGSTLRGKWTLERLLGVGGMAAVYEAVHIRLGRREAVKILHPQISHAGDARQRFEQEARAVTHLRHAGAVEVRDIDVSDEGAPFLVMELLEGESLADSLHRRGPLGPDEVARLADQVLDVLGAAHAVGIVHRDIKPDNLFLCSDGRVKVLDFGVARLRQRDGQQAAPTRTGALIGTVAYMPPEQVSGRSDVDGRADLFSVGATMFRLLTGRHLHPSDNELQQIMQMASEQAPPLLQVAPHVPPAMAAVVDRALAFDREQRFPDAASMQQALREAMPDLVFATISSPPTSPRLGPASGDPSRGSSVSRPAMPSPLHAYEPTVLPTADSQAAPATVVQGPGQLPTPPLGQPSPARSGPAVTVASATATPLAPGVIVPGLVAPAPGPSPLGTSMSPPGLPLVPSPTVVSSSSPGLGPASSPSLPGPPGSSPSLPAYPPPLMPLGPAVAGSPDEPPMVRLGRQTVVLPMPLLAGSAAAVFVVVALLLGSLVWSRLHRPAALRDPEPIINPEVPGTGAAASPTPTPPSPAPSPRPQPPPKDKKKTKKDD